VGKEKGPPFIENWKKSLRRGQKKKRLKKSARRVRENLQGSPPTASRRGSATRKERSKGGPVGGIAKGEGGTEGPV